MQRLHFRVPFQCQLACCSHSICYLERVKIFPYAEPSECTLWINGATYLYQNESLDNISGIQAPSSLKFLMLHTTQVAHSLATNLKKLDMNFMPVCHTEYQLTAP